MHVGKEKKHVSIITAAAAAAAACSQFLQLLCHASFVNNHQETGISSQRGGKTVVFFL
jgi:hypothetical protein